MRWVAAVLVLGLVWVAPVAGPDGAGSTEVTPLAATALEANAAAQPPAGMVEDERAAIAAIDEYWRRHFPEMFGRAYRSPRVVGGYNGTNGPRCAGQRAVAFNAFYCRPGDFLAWDENLMAAGYRQIGDSWIYLVIAHEWGHAIQARIRRGLSERSVELQADCLAGAGLQGAARDGLVTIEAGDDEELAGTLAAAADDYPWTNQRDHGNAEQRIAAFNTGAQKGVQACL
ncbi:MAG: neutral zinc metallopeptidase [Pseudonocardia sp.]